MTILPFSSELEASSYGEASSVRLIAAHWGRPVDVYDRDPNTQSSHLIARDLLVREDIAALLEATAKDGQTRAQSIVPVRTGALRQAIVIAGSTKGQTWRVYVKGPAKRYAPYVEYGTRRVTAYGYMRSARELMRTLLPAGTRIVARKLPGAVARS